MTAIVGILCEDGVVIGSDSCTTMSQGSASTVELPRIRKTFLVGGDAIFAGVGTQGYGQRFERILSRLRKDPQFFQKDRWDIAKTIAGEAVQDFSSTRKPPWDFGALVAFVSENGFHLCEFTMPYLEPEFKTSDGWFSSMGKSQPITDAFLGFIRRVFFGPSYPKLNEGVFAVTWALTQAIELNTGGVNGPLQIATLTRAGADGALKARLLTDDEVGEHETVVKDAERHLARYRQNYSGSHRPPTPDAASPPTLPPP
jgi:hypothetical protein